MTHNFPRDVRILAGLGHRPRYLGILGPRARTDELLAEVQSIARDVYAPVGLDLGAESPEEIALAIVAEIQAVVRGAAAGFLRDRRGPIHLQRAGETVGIANDQITVA
jgi:xanthine/CO dehydrogenase XdhC/CoxF family maturation factor